jgi:hypothetical protein
MRFIGHVFKCGKFWAIEVPILDVVSQGRTKTEAYEMIADAIESLVDRKGFKVRVFRGEGEEFEIGASDQTLLAALLLRRERLKSGMSLAEVAERLAVPPGTVKRRLHDARLRLRQMLLAQRPQMWLSANGSGGANADADWRIGRDWATWARRGYIDFYVPQLYTKSVEDFVQGGSKTKEQLGPCDLVTGLAVSWSGIYPERQAPAVIQEEIRAAKKLGAKGFVVFHLDHCYDGHFQAVRQAIQDQPPRVKP